MAKVDSRFLLDTLSPSTKKKCKTIVSNYPKDSAPHWIWAPNAADFDPLLPPSGFSFSVNANSKIAPDVFSPRKMFYGTAAFQIPAKLLQPEDILQKKDELRAMLETDILTHAVIEPSMQNFSYKTHRDNSSWDTALGGRGAYAGIFASEKRGNDEYVQTVWLVVRAGVPRASEELYANLEKAAGVKTWRDFFLDDPETQRVYDFAQRNRERVLGTLAHHLLPNQLGERIDLKSKMQKEWMLKPSIETLNYTVEFDADSSDERATYYNNTIDASSVRQRGYIFNETPRLGPIIITQNELYESFNDDGGEAILPTSTGRRRNLNTVSASEANSVTPGPLVWDAQQKQLENKRIVPGIFRIRNEAFKVIEARMSHNHIVSELALKPLIVKVCN